MQKSNVANHPTSTFVGLVSNVARGKFARAVARMAARGRARFSLSVAEAAAGTLAIPMRQSLRDRGVFPCDVWPGGACSGHERMSDAGTEHVARRAG